jgi:hypothetical protein
MQAFGRSAQLGPACCRCFQTRSAKESESLVRKVKVTVVLKV